MTLAAILLSVILSSAQSIHTISEEMTNNTDIISIYRMRDFLCTEKYIIHAGGKLKNPETDAVLTATNSYDALVNAYNSGNRLMEFDFKNTSDGHFVCAHRSYKGKWANGLDFIEQPDLETFKTARFSGAFQVMTLEDLVQFMQEHEDLYIVTDVKTSNKDFCTQLSETHPELSDRFIIQIYHENEYDMVRSLGFRHIIYTLYMTEAEERTDEVLLEVAQKDDLVAFTWWASKFDNKEQREAFLKTGVPICVHTVNGEDKIQHYLDLGISAVYTDDVVH